MTDLNTQKASTSDNGSEREQPTPFDQLLERSHLIPQPFTSKLPLIGRVIVWFRSTWNSVSTRWYLAPLLQQQSEFNHLATHELRLLTDKLHVANNELSTVTSELNAMNHKLYALESEAHKLTAERQELRQLIDEISERLIANDKDVVTLSHDLGKVTYALIRLSESQTASSDVSKANLSE